MVRKVFYYAQNYQKAMLLETWDTPNLDKHGDWINFVRNLNRIYTGYNVIVLLFRVDDRNSFRAINGQLVNDVKEKCRNPQEKVPNVNMFFLVGNEDQTDPITGS